MVLKIEYGVIPNGLFDPASIGLVLGQQLWHKHLGVVVGKVYAQFVLRIMSIKKLCRCWDNAFVLHRRNEGNPQMSPTNDPVTRSEQRRVVQILCTPPVTHSGFRTRVSWKAYLCSGSS